MAFLSVNHDGEKEGVGGNRGLGNVVCDLSYRSRCFLLSAQVWPLIVLLRLYLANEIDNPQTLFLFLLCQVLRANQGKDILVSQ